jgi:Fe2+ transport system protein FeoA
MVVNLVDMKSGETGVVVDLQGGSGFITRIQSMGIRIGKEIKKTGAHFWRGPQTVLVDNFKVAIGYGMATSIFIEVKRNEDK